jgi:hypothetical protein
MVLRSIHPLTEISTRNLPGGKGRPGPKADNLTAICKQIVIKKCVSLDVSLTYEPSQSVRLQLFFLPFPKYGIPDLV